MLGLLSYNVFTEYEIHFRKKTKDGSAWTKKGTCGFNESLVALILSQFTSKVNDTLYIQNTTTSMQCPIFDCAAGSDCKGGVGLI